MPTLKRMLLVLAAALAVGPGSARAASPGPPAWSAIAPQVRRALADDLSPAELRRLLGRPEVREALRQQLAGWDGDADVITAERSGGVITLRVTLRERRRRCFRAERPPEAGGDQEICEVAPEVIDRRTLKLTADLWRPPRRPRPRPKPPEPPPEPVAPEAGEPAPTVLRAPGADVDPRLAGMDRAVALLLGDYLQLREERSRGGWADPWEPQRAFRDPLPDVEPARRKRTPLHKLRDQHPAGGRALANLGQIYDESRMQPAWPVPDFFGNAEMAARGRELHLREPDQACLDRLAAGAASDALPPSLACVRGAIRHRRLEASGVHTAVKWIARFVPLPLWSDIMAREVKAAKDETASATAWIVAWLEWARRHPTRLGEALAALDATQRTRLRSRLWRWWDRPPYARWAGVIGDIYEHHFVALYPVARGADGLPDARRFRSRWLWATNWLAALERGGDDGAARTAFDHLGPGERRTIGALVADVQVARRFPRAARALAVVAAR